MIQSANDKTKTWYAYEAVTQNGDWSYKSDPSFQSKVVHYVKARLIYKDAKGVEGELYTADERTVQVK